MEPFVAKREASGVETFRLAAWENEYAGLSAGFSSRIGGVSRGAFDSLNCALHVADDPQAVLENRRRLAAAAGFPFDAWTCAEQVHGNSVTVVTKRERGMGREAQHSAIPNTDALITEEVGVMLVSFYADCVPLFFYDPVRRVAGLAHAGWKGTAKHIAQRTVEAMHSKLNCDPADILAVIGPAIGACCYEVDETVIRAMRQADIAEGWTAKENGKYMLNLKVINEQILRKAGILPTHIEITNLCTSCQSESFFSHRRDQGRSGRMASWIGMMKR